MSTNPNQGQKKPDPTDKYGGYGGYTPQNAAEDPYGAYQQPPNAAAAPQSDPNYAYGQQSTAGQQSTYGQSQAGQQQQYYQPPASATRGKNRGQSASSATAAGPSSSNQQSRRFALFSYLGFCFTGIFFFFSKKRDAYVHYHAAQSVAVFTPALAVLVIINILHALLGWIPILGWLLGLVFGFVTFIVLAVAGLLWLFLMVTSFLGMTVRIPYISTYADALIARFSRRGTA